MEMDFSNWTKESVDLLIQDVTLSNDEKIKNMEEYIKWMSKNLNYVNKNNTIYAPINLLGGYYGLVASKTCDQIKEIMTRSYIQDAVIGLSNSEILSGLTLFAFFYNVTKTLPTF